MAYICMSFWVPAVPGLDTKCLALDSPPPPPPPPQKKKKKKQKTLHADARA